MAIKKSKIGEILQRLMQEKEVHVTELARRACLKQPTVQRIASGVYQRPHVKTLKPIADFFNISIDQLTGAQPIAWLPSKSEIIRRVPILTPTQAASWPKAPEESQYLRTVIDIAAGKNTYALKMPDASMEPLFPKNTLLIIDPEKPLRDRGYVAIKLRDHSEAMFRQLLIDGKDHYIKPLSPDFDSFKMALLQSNDIILGVLVQARLDYEN
jgi:SOS-response transcriptional repressor LexA